MNVTSISVARAFVLALGIVGLGAASAHANAISGVVVDDAGAGLGGVEIEVFDVCTGEELFVFNNVTLSDGSYFVTTGGGTFDVRYVPPASMERTAEERSGVIVGDSTVDLGTTVLETGAIVSGFVRDAQGVALEGVRVSFIDESTGRRLYTLDDRSQPDGSYQVRVPLGTYLVQFRPRSSTSYVVSERPGVVVAGPTPGIDGTVLEGRLVKVVVKDGFGDPVELVDVNLRDTCTGETVPTVGDDTDSSGLAEFRVPAGAYTAEIRPRACRRLETERIPNVVVTESDDLDLGDVTLEAAVRVEGRVVDELGTPVVDATLKFFDLDAGGSRQGSRDDDTGVDGRFSVLVPTSTYDIRVEPPRGTALRAFDLRTVAVGGATDLGDLVAPSGVLLSGRVEDLSGAPLRNVDIDVLGEDGSLTLGRDSTSDDGTFAVVVPEGLYDVRYQPPGCLELMADEQRDELIGGPLTLPTMVLERGVRVTGRVVDDGGTPVAGADLDLRDVVTNDFAPLSDDRTDAEGRHAVHVRSGTWDVRVEPPAGTRLRPTTRPGLDLSVDTDIGDTILAEGVLLSGTVVDDATGAALRDVEVSVFDGASGARLPTTDDATRYTGRYQVAVDVGVWDLRFDPPAGSTLAPRWRRGVSATADVELGVSRLLPLERPTVSSVSPSSGPSAGGTSITVIGSGFQPDAVVLLGGRSVGGLTVVDDSTITAVTKARPAGLVDVEVINPGDQRGALAGGFNYDAPASPVDLRVSRNGADVELSWTSNGSSSFTVFRSEDAQLFGDDQVRGETSSPAFTDEGAATDGNRAHFYLVL